MASNAEVFLAGAVSGLVECLAVQPFDMIKTRFQLNSDANPSVIQSFRSILQEGGFLRFYRGVLPELVGMVPKTSVMYSTYELSSRELDRRISTGSMPHIPGWMVHSLAGLASGYTEAVTVTPFQVVKVRMQSKAYLGVYRNSQHCAWHILTKEGPHAVLLGLGPTCWRNCVWNTVYFGLMFKVKAQLPAASSQAKDVAQSFVAGALAGMLATLFNAPFDVAKSRLQSQIVGPNAPPNRYKHTLQTLALVFREEGGIRAVYKGLAPKMIRMGIGGGVCIASFESLLFFFGGRNVVS